MSKFITDIESHSKMMIGIGVGLFLVVLVVILYLSFKPPPPVVVLAHSPNSASMFNITTPNGFSIGINSNDIVLCDPADNYKVAQEWFIKFNRMLIASSIITQDGLPVPAGQQQQLNDFFVLENFTNTSPTYFDFEFISKGKYAIATIATTTTAKRYIAPATADKAGSKLGLSDTPFVWSTEIAPQVPPPEKQDPPSSTGNSPDPDKTYTISTIPTGGEVAKLMTVSANSPTSGSPVTLTAATTLPTQLWSLEKGNIVPATSQNAMGIDPSSTVATSGPTTVIAADPSKVGPFTFVAVGKSGDNKYQILTPPRTINGVSITKQLIPSTQVDAVYAQILSTTDIPYVWQLTESPPVSGLEYQPSQVLFNPNLYSCGGCGGRC